MYYTKYIWNTQNSIKDFIEKFKILVKNIKSSAFSIKNEDNKSQIIELKTNKFISLNNKSFSNEFMKKMLAIWITLGLIKTSEKFEETIDKEKLLDFQYKIQTKKNGVDLKKYILKHFGNLMHHHYFSLKRINENGAYRKSSRIIISDSYGRYCDETYTDEHKTYYSILMGALLEKELVEKKEMPIFFDSQSDQMVIQKCWTGSGIPFDRHLLDIAKGIYFITVDNQYFITVDNQYKKISNPEVDEIDEINIPAINGIDEIKKDDYQFKYEIKKDLQINKKYTEYYDAEKNVTIRSYSLFSILNTIIEERETNFSSYRSNSEPHQNPNIRSLTHLVNDFLRVSDFSSDNYIGSDRTFGNILVNCAIRDDKTRDLTSADFYLLYENPQFISLLFFWRIIYLYSFMYQERLEIDKITHKYFKLESFNNNKVTKVLNSFDWYDSKKDYDPSYPIDFSHNILLGNNYKFNKFINYKNTKEEDIKRYKDFKNMFLLLRREHIRGSLTQKKFDNIIKAVLNQIVLIKFISPDKNNKKI